LTLISLFRRELGTGFLNDVDGKDYGMKKKAIFARMLILLAFALVFGCASIKRSASLQEKIAMLEQEIQNWREFKITGISEFQTPSITLRNNCIIQKKADKFRFDVLNSGLLGLGSSYLMQFYADQTKIMYREPMSPDIKKGSINIAALHWVKFFTDTMYDELLANKEEIVQSQSTQIEGFIIKFSSKMRLSQIANLSYDLRLNFYYDRHDNLYEIRATVPLIRNLTIHVDRIEHHDIFVNELH